MVKLEHSRYEVTLCFFLYNPNAYRQQLQHTRMHSSKAQWVAKLSTGIECPPLEALLLHSLQREFPLQHQVCVMCRPLASSGSGAARTDWAGFTDSHWFTGTVILCIVITVNGAVNLVQEFIEYECHHQVAGSSDVQALQWTVCQPSCVSGDAVSIKIIKLAYRIWHAGLFGIANYYEYWLHTRWPQ